MNWLTCREPVSAWTHFAWLMLALPATWVLWRLSRGSLLKRLGGAIFGLSLVLCYAGSWLYHAVPPALASAAVRAALPFAAGQVAGAAPERIIAFAEIGLRSLGVSRLKVAALLCAVVGSVGIAGGVLAHRSATERPAVATAGDEAPRARPPAAQPQPGKDLFGDPLPDGAIARLGTVQRRLSPQQLAQTADGKSLVGVILGRFVTIWDAQTFQVKERFELNRPEGDAKVISSLLAPDARTGAVFTPRGVEFWDLSSRKLRKIASKHSQLRAALPEPP